MVPLKYEKIVSLQQNQSPLTGYSGLSLLEAIYKEEKNLSLNVKGIKAPREGAWLPINGSRAELEEILRQFGDNALDLGVNVAIPKTPDGEKFNWTWMAPRAYDYFPTDYTGNLPQIDLRYNTRRKKPALAIRVAGFSKADIEKAVEKIDEILFPTKT